MQVKARQGKARLGEARQGKARLEMMIHKVERKCFQLL
jgi:hypothetical protein